ncbi:MAG: MFS transporter [Thermoleophilia bacterium]|nr:MFS transporter [Thermoleophilia bacterium]
MAQLSAIEGRGALSAACVIGFAAGWVLTNVGAIASEISSSYGVSLATVGLFTTALFISHMAMQVPGGKASDRFGARQVGMVGAGIMIAGSAMALPAPDLMLGLVARFVTGIGTGLAFIAGAAYVRSTGGSAVAQGLFGGVAISAGGVALAVVPLFEPGLSWRAPYVTGLVISAVALVALMAAPVDSEHLTRARTRAAGVLTDRRLRRLAVLFSASFGLSVVLGNWVVELLERNADVSNTTAGAIGGLTLLLGVFSRPLGGWLLVRHPESIRLMVGISLAAGAAGTAALMLAEPLWLAALGGVLVGLGGGISFSPAFTGAAMVRPDAPAGAVGFVNGTAAMTILVGTPLLGLTFSLPSDGRVGFAIVAALWLVALALLPHTRSLGVPATVPEE